MKRVILPVLLIFFLACSTTEYDELKETSLLEFLPDKIESLAFLPSHQALTRELFTIFVYFFESEALAELRSKLFRNLENELGLNLLSPSSIEKNGLAIDQNLAFGTLGDQRFYLSLPLSDPKRAADFVSRFVGSFSNHQSLLWANQEGLSCVLSQNRLYLLTGGNEVGTNQASWIRLESELKGEAKGLIARIALDNLFLKKSLSLLYVNPGHSILTLARNDERLTLELRGAGLALDLLAPFRASLPIALPLAWAQGGYGINGFFSPGDLAGLSLILDLNSIWQASLRPLLASQVKRSVKGLDSPLTKLLSGGKPLDEWILGILDIENSIIARLTGRVGLVLSDLKNFSILAITPARLQRAFDGALVIETQNPNQAKAIFDHLSGLTILPTGNQLKISQLNEAGQALISFSAPRFRMPDVFVGASGRLILVGLDKASLLRLMSQGEYRGGIELSFGKATFDQFSASPHDLSLTLSPQALLAALTRSLDQGTRRNIEPFAEQIKKLARLSLVQFRQKETSLLVEAKLKSAPVAQDPLGDTDQEGDSLLIVLGLILLAVFLGPLIFKIFSRKRF